MSSLRFLNIDFFASFEEYHQIINHDGKEIALWGHQTQANLLLLML